MTGLRDALLRSDIRQHALRLAERRALEAGDPRPAIVGVRRRFAWRIAACLVAPAFVIPFFSRAHDHFRQLAFVLDVLLVLAFLTGALFCALERRRLTSWLDELGDTTAQPDAASDRAALEALEPRFDEQRALEQGDPLPAIDGIRRRAGWTLAVGLSAVALALVMLALDVTAGPSPSTWVALFVLAVFGEHSLRLAADRRTLAEMRDERG